MRMAEVFNLVIKCDGCLFCGVIRDFLRGDLPRDLPRDLDVSVRNHAEFYEQAGAL